MDKESMHFLLTVYTNFRTTFSNKITTLLQQTTLLFNSHFSTWSRIRRRKAYRIQITPTLATTNSITPPSSTTTMSWTWKLQIIIYCQGTHQLNHSTSNKTSPPSSRTTQCFCRAGIIQDWPTQWSIISPSRTTLKSHSSLYRAQVHISWWLHFSRIWGLHRKQSALQRLSRNSFQTLSSSTQSWKMVAVQNVLCTEWTKCWSPVED